MFNITSFPSPCQAPLELLYMQTTNQHATCLQAMTEQPLPTDKTFSATKWLVNFNQNHGFRSPTGWILQVRYQNRIKSVKNHIPFLLRKQDVASFELYQVLCISNKVKGTAHEGPWDNPLQENSYRHQLCCGVFKSPSTSQNIWLQLVVFTFDKTQEEPPAKDSTTEIVACPSHIKSSNQLLIWLKVKRSSSSPGRWKFSINFHLIWAQWCCNLVYKTKRSHMTCFECREREWESDFVQSRATL